MSVARDGSLDKTALSEVTLAFVAAIPRPKYGTSAMIGQTVGAMVTLYPINRPAIALPITWAGE
jgi:hypothetical protein